MKEELTDITFILDRSGSMQSIKDETIDGFNRTLDEQQKVGQTGRSRTRQRSRMDRGQYVRLHWQDLLELLQELQHYQSQHTNLQKENTRLALENRELKRAAAEKEETGTKEATGG